MPGFYFLAICGWYEDEILNTRIQISHWHNCYEGNTQLVIYNKVDDDDDDDVGVDSWN